MTQKLFYEDSFMKTFSAQVLECCPDEEGYQIVLDRTVVFRSGGQYADRGHLNQICVTDVQERMGKSITRQNMRLNRELVLRVRSTGRNVL